VVPIRIERLAQLRRADDLRGDIVTAVHHVQVHVAVETLQWMTDEQRGGAADFRSAPHYLL